MDIIITGEKGAGKTREAQRIIANYRPRFGKRLDDADVLFILDAYFSPAGLITEMLRSARVRAVVFDGCILNPSHMLAAVAAVKEYRKQINSDVLAIYVAHGSAVMLTDGPAAMNEFRQPHRDNYGAAFDREFMGELETASKPVSANRSDRILADLWDAVAENASEACAKEMTDKLDSLCNARVPENNPATGWGLHHLDADGKRLMHAFLLILSAKYE